MSARDYFASEGEDVSDQRLDTIRAAWVEDDYPLIEVGIAALKADIAYLLDRLAEAEAALAEEHGNADRMQARWHEADARLAEVEEALDKLRAALREHYRTGEYISLGIAAQEILLEHDRKIQETDRNYFDKNKRSN